MKNKIKTELLAIKKEIPVFELVLWWIMRGCMIWGTVVDTDSMQQAIFALDTLACFSITLIKLITPKKSFFHRISYHVQTMVIFTAWIGFFMGHYVGLNHSVNKFDFYLHILSGATVTVIGYYLSKAVVDKRECPSSMKVLGAVGFSFTAIVGWELMEFFADYYIGSSNQAYTWVEEERNLFTMIFGQPKNIAQMPVVDTNADMFFATLTTVITGIVIYLIIRKKEKKKIGKQN